MHNIFAQSEVGIKALAWTRTWYIEICETYKWANLVLCQIRSIGIVEINDQLFGTDGRRGDHHASISSICKLFMQMKQRVYLVITMKVVLHFWLYDGYVSGTALIRPIVPTIGDVCIHSIVLGYVVWLLLQVISIAYIGRRHTIRSVERVKVAICIAAIVSCQCYLYVILSWRKRYRRVGSQVGNNPIRLAILIIA